ncbi:phytoene desaturase family protein [Apilactobacillus xinyiensis]|uniref:phytoene desaturase family protein n=1 Tax=Apilactobacillus xinyiensis TaxID=2841032 RepID=UPI001C7CC94B|nr:phytoene desaturase family protein [Apilactobacillus xinyiensis]
MKKNIAIVGAGVGGLTTAIYLQHAGYQVTIFEKNSRVGGKMDRIEKDGFKFDTGPTIVMMPKVYDQPFKDTEVDPRDYFTMQRVNPFMDIKTGNKTIPLSTDLVDLTNEFENVDESEMLGFLKYLTDIYEKYLNAKDNFIYKSFRSPKDFFNPKTLWQAYKLKTFSSSYGAIQKYISNTNLQYLLSFQTLYIGISPFNGPSIYNIIPMIELLYGVWFIKGGMSAYADALLKRYLELGGQVKYDSPVSQIVINANREATGVLVDGDKYNFDGVVANADFPYVMNNLLDVPEKYKTKYTKTKVDQMDYSMSCFMLYLGVDKKYDRLRLHTIKMAKDFSKNVEEIDNGKLPSDPSYYIYNPSCLDDSFAPKGQSSLYILVPVSNLQKYDKWDDYNSDNFEEFIIKKVQNELGLDNLGSHIVTKCRFTPRTFASRYNSKFGTAFGLKPTLMQSNYFRPHNKAARIKNLYFTGASTHPGAGVPIVVTSGYLTANELKKDLKPNE